MPAGHSLRRPVARGKYSSGRTRSKTSLKRIVRKHMRLPWKPSYSMQLRLEVLHSQRGIMIEEERTVKVHKRIEMRRRELQGDANPEVSWKRKATATKVTSEPRATPSHLARTRRRSNLTRVLCKVTFPVSGVLPRMEHGEGILTYLASGCPLTIKQRFFRESKTLPSPTPAQAGSLIHSRSIYKAISHQEINALLSTIFLSSRTATDLTRW